jgi:hypothetical protein
MGCRVRQEGPSHMNITTTSYSKGMQVMKMFRTGIQVIKLPAGKITPDIQLHQQVFTQSRHIDPFWERVFIAQHC